MSSVEISMESASYSPYPQVDFDWEFDKFDAEDERWSVVHARLNEMAKHAKLEIERSIDYETMPELLRDVMLELAIHDKPTAQHADHADDEGVWSIDYLVSGMYVIVWYWPDGYDD